MSPPFRTLRWILWPAFFLLAGLLVLPLFSLLSPDPPSGGFICFQIGLIPSMILLHRWQQRWLWKFCPRVRRFATTETARVTLHYEPEVEWGNFIPCLLRECEKELDNLTRWFGSSLRGRVTVYVFAHWQDIAAIYGPGYGGWAISRANAIVIASDNRVEESMRHELAHLFAFRLSVNAPPLLSEGLPVWLQKTDIGQPIHDAALPLLLLGTPKLSLLLHAKFFFAERHRQSCYILAGSFTGFLIHRYGWDHYRQLYRSCNGIRFAAKFQRCLGISLETAARIWRDELLVLPAV